MVIAHKVFPREMSQVHIPSGKLTVCYGKSPFAMGLSSVMASFHSHVKLPESIFQGDSTRKKTYIHQQNTSPRSLVGRNYPGDDTCCLGKHDVDSTIL